MENVLMVWFVVLLVVGCNEARNKSPLMEEDGTRMRNKAAECVFGKQVKELGSQWIPDLGVPIGVLYCMKCECVPFHRKRRVVGRVHCSSIKNECPEPTCDEPVLLPGRCCKSCPGDSDENNPDNIQDIVPQNVNEEEEKSTKHYAALLTGRSSLVVKTDYAKLTPELNKNNVVATGRFSFHRKNLYYSFYISEKAARPRSLQFVDNEGTILEEFTLSHAGGLVNSVYQNATRKVCGVWKRLPRDYRKLLKQNKMFVVLIWGVKDKAEFTLSGQLLRYVSLGSEMLSSLLEPAPGTDLGKMAGAGGTAIISTSASVSTSIHIAIIFNGLFTSEDTYDVPMNITLSLDEKKQVILDETIRVGTPARELNLIEFSSPISPAHLRLLSRGRLLLSISSISKPEALRLSGTVITKASCELFQTTLVSSSMESSYNPNEVSGVAWMYLNNVGSLIYNIEIENLVSRNAIITLLDISTKRRTELEDLTPSWANGTLEKLSPKILEPLYSGNLAVNVDIPNEASLTIRGKLVAKPVADARDSPAPILMKRENHTLPSTAAGIAWVSVDNDCHLHYDVSMAGVNTANRKFDLFIEMYPMIAPGAPFISKFLEEFHGYQIDGSPVEALNKEELSRLDTGVSFLKVKDHETGVILLTATVTKVKVPSTCRAPITDNNVPFLFDNPESTSTGACYYEDKFYAEETSWSSATDPCKMCFCQNSKVTCDSMKCPKLSCPDGLKTMVKDECCPVCALSNQVTPRKCLFNGLSFTPGSKFHPFLIPIGFDLCTICTCDATDSEIKCDKISNNEKSCCNNCNKSFDTNSPVSDDHVPVLLGEMPRKEPPTKLPQKIYEEGGCINPSNPMKPYGNGTEYHPFLESIGLYKCVKCRCENGKAACKRTHCELDLCKKMSEMRRRKEPFQPSDFCCPIKECKKLLRAHRKNRPHNS